MHASRDLLSDLQCCNVRFWRSRKTSIRLSASGIIPSQGKLCPQNLKVSSRPSLTSHSQLRAAL